MKPGGIPFIVERRAGGEEVAFTMKAHLDTSPARNQREAVARLRDAGSGILAAKPGKGKTVMALALASRLQTKTLIVVPTTMLLDQWRDRIIEHTSLCREAIGTIQGDRADFDCPVIVGMLQTIAQRDYPEDQLRRIGCFIADEVHRFGASTWVHSISKFPALYRYGLSATVERKDGMHVAIKHHIGPIVYSMMEETVKPNVYRLLTGASFSPRETDNPWNGEFNAAKALTAVTNHLGRNRMLARELFFAYEKKRKVLALSRRIEQLEWMMKELEKHGVPPDHMGLMIGPTKLPKRKEILATKRLIFATDKLAGEGLDQEDLDTMIWLCPSQNVDQNAGRLRGTGANPPYVIDPVDNHWYFHRLAGARLKRYKSLGWTTTDVNKSNTVAQLAG